MTDQNIYEHLEQIKATLKKYESNNSAYHYLLILLAKSDPNLHFIANEYGELIVHLSQQNNADQETLEEMKNVLHTLHGIMVERNDFS